MSRTIRTLSAVALLVCTVAACGGSAEAAKERALAPPAIPGQPAGTVVIPAGSDAAAAVKRVQDAIAAGGGKVAATVDHTADAKAAGVVIPADTVVIGGSPAGQTPMLRFDQRAGANLPERYLVRQGSDGAVTITYDGAEYISAVSGVTDPAASTALSSEIAAVGDQAGPASGTRLASPLIGVSPSNYLLTVFGSADVATTVTRLRTNANRGATKVVADVDLAAGTANPGPALRPTSVVLVGEAAAEAPLIAAAPSFGLEMPMRFVVWLDAQNRTTIGYPDVRRLATRHGIPADDPNVVRLATDADRISKLAAGTVQ
jgi:uncharacterized protein (DUF302 family)